MKTYELVLIINAQLEAGKQTKLVADVSKTVKDLGGEVKKEDKLGLKEFAYPIKKQLQGVYVDFELNLDPATVKKLEDKLATEESILRHLLVLKTKGEE